MSIDQSPNAANAIVQSLVLYSVAEAQAGHTSQIDVQVRENHFSVQDNGRGHSLSRQVDGIPYVDLIYDQLTYPFGRLHGPTVQLQGIATSLVRALCSYFAVTVRRDGHCHRIVFTQPGKTTTTEEPASIGLQGNTIEGSLAALVQAGFDELALLEWLQHVSASTPGLSIQLNGRRVMHGCGGA